MAEILTILIPLFTVILIGYLCSFNKRFMRAEAPINALVFYVALPGMLFLAVYEGTPLTDFPPAYIWVILATIIGSSLLLFGLMIFGGRRSSRVAAQVAMGGSYGNIVYYGIPIAIGLFGPVAGVTFGIGQMVHNLFFMIFYPVVVSLLPGGKRISYWAIFKRSVLFNPVAMSIIAGLAYGYTGLPLPTLVSAPMELLGQIATPGALFCIGLTFRQSFKLFRAGSIKPIDLGVTVFGKLVILPIITAVVVRVWFPDMGDVWASSLILMAAMPTSTTAYLSSAEFDDDASLLASTVVMTSLFSLITVPLVIFYLV